MFQVPCTRIVSKNKNAATMLALNEWHIIKGLTNYATFFFPPAASNALSVSDLPFPVANEMYNFR